MQLGSPRQALDLIQTRMEAFARSGDDDPKGIVDGVMHDIEALVRQHGNGASGYLQDIETHTKLMLNNVEKEPDQRRVLFLRSLAQLLASRQALTP